MWVIATVPMLPGAAVMRQVILAAISSMSGRGQARHEACRQSANSKPAT